MDLSNQKTFKNFQYLVLVMSNTKKIQYKFCEAAQCVELKLCPNIRNVGSETELQSLTILDFKQKRQNSV